MIYPINPVAKPRQTRADKWKQRPAVMRYRAFADECRLRGVSVREGGDRITFTLPMPKSWSKKKRAEMCDCSHQQKPDIDNLLKALFDAVMKEDCAVWDIRARKIWGEAGSIKIEQTPL